MGGFRGPPEQVGAYLRGLRQLFRKYGYECALYGHFGQGCIHTRIDFDLITKEGIEQHRAFIEEAADLVLSFGGSLSGEHGDGQPRGELLPKMFGAELMQAVHLAELMRLAVRPAGWTRGTIRNVASAHRGATEPVAPPPSLSRPSSSARVFWATTRTLMSRAQITDSRR